MVVEQKKPLIILTGPTAAGEDKAFYWSGKKYWRRDYQCRFHAGV